MARSKAISATSGAPSGSARAGVTFARQLGAGTRELVAAEAALRARGDVAAVHAYRVALRSLRSLFRLALPLFAPEDAARFRADFAWLSARSSPVRDLDVLRESLPDYLGRGARYTARLEAALLPVLDAFRARHAADLLTALDSSRHRELWRDWRRALGILRRDGAAQAPLAPLLADMLGQRHARLMRYSPRRLQRPEVMHAFRKDCKRLRYALEAFAPRFDPAELGTALSLCRKVQSACGARWDIEVHRALLDTLGAHAPEPLAARDLARLADALTRAEEKRSTAAMKACGKLQRGLHLPALRAHALRAT